MQAKIQNIKAEAELFKTLRRTSRTFSEKIEYKAKIVELELKLERLRTVVLCDILEMVS